MGSVPHTLLITGATGSIGTKLRHYFGAQEQFALRLLCINPRQDPAILTADLATYDEAWARHFAGVDTVIHLAGAAFSDSSWELVQRLNIDLSLNVLRAAEQHRVRRIVFASSNWVLAGYRFGDQPLTPTLPPWPVNPYGCSKLCVERAGRDWAARTGRSFLALRIGYCQHAPGNIPGPHMENGLWGQQMWLSDRDLCQAVHCAVLAPDLPYAMLNVMSANPGMRWDIATTRQLIGYEPQDGHVAIGSPDAPKPGSAEAALERVRWFLGR